MDNFKYEMLSLENVWKYVDFFKKEIILNSKKGIVEKQDIEWLLDENSVEYMTKILTWTQKESSFISKKWIKIYQLFDNNFTQLVFEKETEKVVWILDAREFWNEWSEFSYLNIWRVFVDKKFQWKWIASKLYKNLEIYGRNNPKLYKITSNARKTNIISHNLHIKLWYKLIETDEIHNYYFLDISN